MIQESIPPESLTQHTVWRRFGRCWRLFGAFETEELANIVRRKYQPGYSHACSWLVLPPGESPLAPKGKCHGGAANAP